MGGALSYGAAGRTILAASVIGLVAVVSPAPAQAAGGGSGGMRPQASQVDPAQAYRDGVAHLEAGEYRKAEKKFDQVLEVAPKDPNTNYLMALALIGREKQSRARRYLRTAIKGRPDFVEARRTLGIIHMERGDEDDAREQLAAIEDILSACDELCSEERRALIVRERDALRQVIEGPEDDTPENASGDEADEASNSQVGRLHQFAGGDLDNGQYLSAVALINEARYAEAILKLRAAEKRVGPHADILNYLGYAHRKLGQFGAARGYYKQALAIEPNHKGATEYLGELYLETGDVTGAKQQLARLDEICTFGCAERQDLARLLDSAQTATP